MIEGTSGQAGGAREFRIWGRIERLPGGDSFRAIAAAAPDEPGSGPDPADMRAETLHSFPESQVALGRLLYELSGVVKGRGDEVAWLDVR